MFKLEAGHPRGRKFQLDGLVLVESDGDVVANLLEWHRHGGHGRVGRDQPCSGHRTVLDHGDHSGAGRHAGGKHRRPEERVDQGALSPLELAEHHQAKATVTQAAFYRRQACRALAQPQLRGHRSQPLHHLDQVSAQDSVSIVVGLSRHGASWCSGKRVLRDPFVRANRTQCGTATGTMRPPKRHRSRRHRTAGTRPGAGGFACHELGAIGYFGID